MRHDPVTALVLDLTRYLSVNRDASDSADGIARWWLATPPDRGSLMNALAWLEDHGFIEQIVAADGHVRYRRASRAEPTGSDPLSELIDSLERRGPSGESH